MKTIFKTAAASALLLFSSSTMLRADINDMIALAMYADQLTDHGIVGGRFVELVDDRYWGMYPGEQYPGMGAYVQDLHARGLRGRALADAIHAEQARRGIPSQGRGNGNGNANVKVKPLPPGQAKKYGVTPVQGPPGQLKLKPKEKAQFFGGGNPGKGNGNGNGNGKGKNKNK